MNAKAWDRIASNYFDEVLSPFQEGVRTPLFRRLEKIRGAKHLAAGDLGCGVGNLLPRLAPRFGRVYAVDFSPGMLKEARAAHGGFNNVAFLQRSMTDLTPLHGQLDVAVAINSVLSPSSLDNDAMLAEIEKTLRPGGLFFGVFPSMEAVLYQGSLVFEREIERVGDEVEALRRAHRKFERSKYRFLAGTYEQDGDKQKLYYSFELRRRLRKAGLKAIRVGKVQYPWDGVGGYESFPDAPPMWDWFVQARKG